MTTKEATQIGFKRTAQERKAAALVAILRKYRYTVELVERMSDKDWALVSECAHVRTPGKETREMVLAELRRG